MSATIGFLLLALGLALVGANVMRLNRQVRQLRRELAQHRHPAQRKAARRSPGEGATGGPEMTSDHDGRPAQRTGRHTSRKDATR